jgi:putative DNA primase/helicase
MNGDAFANLRQAREAKRATNNNKEARPPNFTDEALALLFAERHADALRYVAGWSRWLSFDGKCWNFDNTLFSFDRSRKICREAAASCNKAKLAAMLASAKTVSAVERLARADRRLAGTVDEWDCDPFILNTPAGVLELRTGNMRAHRADDYLMKITAVAPDPACATPLWDAVIETATGNDTALSSYLQRLFGYALTGSTREHSLHFAYGTGANSKGTVINTIAGILGAYHTAAPIETFTASAFDRHPTDLADLHGARMVSATETEEGRRWAESRIKALTGGDRIKARFMRQDFFEYTPQFTLIIMGNHKPLLRSVDEAIRRRFHLIPFEITIPPEQRDQELGEKLQAEWPGILQWCIAGCLEWQRQGLNPPPSVQDATASYLEAQDALTAWLDECCNQDRISWDSRKRLWTSWSTWALNAGEFVGNRRTFIDAMENRFEPKRLGDGTRGFKGVEVKSEDDD